MQCKELEAVFEGEGLSPLPPEAREHLASCTSCQELLADLSAIVVAAKRVPAEVTPPDRVWVSIRAQLEAEGIIRDIEPVLPAAASAPWWLGFADLFRPRVLASVGAGLLVVFGSIYVVEHRGANKMVVQTPQAVQTQVSQTPTATPESVTPAPAPVSQTPTVVAKSSPQIPHSPRATSPSTARVSTVDGLRPSPSEDMYLGDTAGVLSQTENALPRRELANNPAVDASLRQNLHTLNEFIAECESRLKQNPQDQLTREYLNMAYQQKAELLNAMMNVDSGRSEH
jgi:hypothetical protein